MILTGTPQTLAGKLEVLRELHLPIHGAAASGSMVFAEMGVTPSDLDVLCTKEVWERYAAHPDATWRTTPAGHTTFAVHSAEFFCPGLLSQFAPDVEEALASTQIRWGIPFLSVRTQRDWKARVGRPKDLYHVAIVDWFLSSGAPIPGLSS